jgi:hypothetical protein
MTKQNKIDITIALVLAMVLMAGLATCATMPQGNPGGMQVIDHTIDRSLPQEKVPCK